MPQYCTSHEKDKKYLCLVETQPYFFHDLKCILIHKHYGFDFYGDLFFVCNQFLSEFQKCKGYKHRKRWQLTKLLSLTF